MSQKNTCPGPESLAGPPKKLHTEIIERIRELIREKELGPGSRLPAERTLARSLGVSRNSVREAIRQLEEGGILESRRGAGTYVATNDTTILARALTREMERKMTRIHEIFEIRSLLEPQIAGLAAAKIAPDQVARLRDIVAKQQSAVGNIKRFTALDTRFHDLLVQASGNEVLEQIMRTLRTILKESRCAPLMTTTRQEASIKGHTAIVDALESGNVRETIAAMGEHIREIKHPARFLTRP
jgi:GntR family transcriptional repressor for pyruvate dehydrogenase complex